MEMRIGARNKIGTLQETRQDPNQVTQGWKHGSQNHRVKDIWEVVARTFYDGTDETYIFKLNQRSFTTKQNGHPLSTYYTELVAIFQESIVEVHPKRG